MTCAGTRFAPNPEERWQHKVIGPAVHAGIAAVGDLDGDGDLDIVRTNIWYENVSGDGAQWQVRPIGPNTYPPEDFRPRFAFDGVRAAIRDMNGNGINDIVFSDAEIPGGQVWWMENLDGVGHYWKRHDICRPTVPRRGALHSLHVADLDGDGDYDVFSCEMEYVRGDGTPKFYIWENLDGAGGSWQEHVIFDGNLGGHEAVVGDVTGNGLARYHRQALAAASGKRARRQNVYTLSRESRTGLTGSFETDLIQAKQRSAHGDRKSENRRSRLRRGRGGLLSALSHGAGKRGNHSSLRPFIRCGPEACVRVFGAREQYSDYYDMLEKSNIDAVFILTAPGHACSLRHGSH